MKEKDKEQYTDVSSVEKQRENLVPEEFPEGPFGSAIRRDDPIFSKSSSWKKGQRRQSAFVYADKEQHDDLPRQAPGAHPIHDEAWEE
ncbi:MULTISPECIES: hypothetical protein [unclassified Virgibacillus]|uniref:hypothetical protein n=1 Tax=unclassified Virgibacillus TaxID=2620237 RepID=UPI0024DE5C18|nr:hypothetical protein [Virgibacillus sp. LDC-1]